MVVVVVLLALDVRAVSHENSVARKMQVCEMKYGNYYDVESSQQSKVETLYDQCAADAYGVEYHDSVYPDSDDSSSSDSDGL